MKGLRSKATISMLALALLVPTMASAAEQTGTTTPTVVINGVERPAVKNVTITMWFGKNVLDINGEQWITMDVAPELINQATYIPLRYFAEAIGASLSQNGEYTVLTTKDLTASFKVGDTTIMLNGAEVELGGYIGEKDGRIVVPVRALGSMLGWSIGYDIKGTVYMTKAFPASE